MVLSVVTARHGALAGIVAEPGFFFRKKSDQGTYHAVVTDGLTEQDVDTGVVPSANPLTPDELLVEGDQGSIRFFINGALKANISLSLFGNPALIRDRAYYKHHEATSALVQIDYNRSSLGRGRWFKEEVEL